LKRFTNFKGMKPKRGMVYIAISSSFKPAAYFRDHDLKTYQFQITAYRNEEFKLCYAYKEQMKEIPCLPEAERNLFANQSGKMPRMLFQLSLNHKDTSKPTGRTPQQYITGIFTIFSQLNFVEMVREGTETYYNRLTIIYGLADTVTKNEITTFAVRVNKLYDSPDVST
jgi:hypothetical protein